MLSREHFKSAGTGCAKALMMFALSFSSSVVSIVMKVEIFAAQYDRLSKWVKSAAETQSLAGLTSMTTGQHARRAASAGLHNSGSPSTTSMFP